MIYFAMDNSGNNIKIGFTNLDPKIRISQLNTSSADKIILIGTMPGEKSDEAKLHEIYKEYRKNGEWFRTNPHLISFIINKTRPVDSKKPSVETDLDYIEEAVLGIINKSIDIIRLRSHFHNNRDRYKINCVDNTAQLITEWELGKDKIIELYCRCVVSKNYISKLIEEIIILFCKKGPPICGELELILHTLNTIGYGEGKFNPDIHFCCMETDVFGADYVDTYRDKVGIIKRLHLYKNLYAGFIGRKNILPTIFGVAEYRKIYLDCVSKGD